MDRITRPAHRALAAVLVLAAALTGGCVQGQGPVTSETREIRPFSAIEVGAGIHLAFSIGATDHLEVRAQANILPAIATDVSGGTLTIEARDDFTTSEPVTVTVVGPLLERIALSGGAQGRLEGIAAGAIELTLKGGAHLTIAGSADAVTLIADGGSVAELADLAATRVSVALAGGAGATVRAADEVTGIASGGSRLSVLGDPSIAVDVSGGASVARP